MKTFRKSIITLALVLAMVLSFGIIPAYATSTTVSDMDGLTNALTANATIYLNAGTYNIPANFSIPAGVTLIGVDGAEVIFNTGTNLTSGQAGFYIQNSNVTIRNITFTNSSSSEKPVVKIGGNNVTLENCKIINASYKSSALVMHGCTGMQIKGGQIKNADVPTLLKLRYTYPVVQANVCPDVKISNGTQIITGSSREAHITFAYSSTGSTDYTTPTVLTIDYSVVFGGEADGYAAIYSEAPASVNRNDQVKVIVSEGAEPITLLRQDSVVEEGLLTEGTGWYCYNAEAYSDLLNDYEGFVYSNASDPDDVPGL